MSLRLLLVVYVVVGVSLIAAGVGVALQEDAERAEQERDSGQAEQDAPGEVGVRLHGESKGGRGY